MVQSDRLTTLRAARDALSRRPGSPRRDALLREICRRIVVTETGEFDGGGWSRKRHDPDGRRQLPAAFGL
jgi:hypothetical protein